jgi:hypothetical protein
MQISEIEIVLKLTNEATYDLHIASQAQACTFGFVRPCLCPYLNQKLNAS